MAYVDKIQNKAGVQYDIQDARIAPVTSSVANQVVMANAQGTGLTYGTVDVSGSISAHNVATDAHSDIRTLVSNEATTRGNADTALDNRITAIEGKIPSEATSSNQLADKAFVNSSISTETAHYISDNGQPFTSVAALEAYTGTVTNNDYAFVTGTDTAGNTYYDRYKATVSGSTVTWAKEYRLNNSSFTAAQWSAISSGITASDKTKLDGIASGATAVSVSASGTASDSVKYITINGTEKKLAGGDQVTFTLPAISAGGTANVSVSGITANTIGVFGLQPSATSAQYAAAAKSQLQLTAQTTNQITVRANGEALAAGLPCVITIMG